jgi:hypothetical protein
VNLKVLSARLQERYRSRHFIPSSLRQTVVDVAWVVATKTNGEVVLGLRVEIVEMDCSSSLSDLGVSLVFAGCLFLARKSATIENTRLTKFFAAKSDRLLGKPARRILHFDSFLKAFTSSSRAVL